MDNLEYEIKKVYTESDCKTVFSGKEAMWNRLDNAMYKSKGVAALWRLAAVFAGLLLVAGAFAGLNYQGKIKSEINAFQTQNTQLQLTIDSLLSRPIEIHTKTEMVEKVVYRDRVLQVNPVEKNYDWETKYQQLKDSTNRIIIQKEISYLNELQQLKLELKTTNEILLTIRNQSDKPEQTTKEPFQLKSERVDLGILNSLETKAQGIEVKILPQSITGNKNNINKSILNNLP